MNPFTDVNFGPAPCLPCCTTPTPPSCLCALLIPIKASSGLDPFGEPPYASYSDAVTGISDFVYSCLMWAGWGVTPTTLDAASIAVTSTIAVTMNDSAVSGGGSAGRSIISLALKSGDTISIAASGSSNISPPFGNLLGASLYKCDGTFIDNDETEGDSASLSLSVPDDGEYVLVLYIDIADGTTFTYSATVSFGDTWTINPVIALWDDSGTTRSLWACPKLLLPPLTESTGDWYASCVDAEIILGDPVVVSNCEGYYDNVQSSGLVDSFTFSSGVFSGTSSTSPFSGFGFAWFSVNSTAGASIGVSCSGLSNVQMDIYDDTGILLESVSGIGSATSSPLPYTGRYTIRSFSFSPPPGAPTTSASITFSGYDSINPVQARYDLGLSCAGTLNCGDACP